jgi:hypothetical protein
MQDERIKVRAKLNNQERHAVSHQETNCTELWEILKANSLTAPTGPGLASIRRDSRKLNPPCGCSRLRGRSVFGAECCFDF